jgi:hypothetical protein
MVFIKYPLTSLNNHPDLVAWHNKVKFNEGDWTNLIDYLFQHPLKPHGIKYRLPKCWYTELLQADIFAQDVEHFRPKNRATPLTPNQRKKIDALIGYPVPEAIDMGAYKWLEFNPINYRFTTALPNRGGGKAGSFPILYGTKRLPENVLPGNSPEYPLLLDPCNILDANLLLVLPSGEIIPKALSEPLIALQLEHPEIHWHENAFNFLRAWITIVVYRLDNKELRKGREEIYEETTKDIKQLEKTLATKNIELIKRPKEIIKQRISNYSPFALAARCALLSYIPENNSIGRATELLISNIYNEVINSEAKAN